MWAIQSNPYSVWLVERILNFILKFSTGQVFYFNQVAHENEICNWK